MARLLADAGRPEEAEAFLDSDRPEHRRTLGLLLIERGRAEEAVTLLRAPRSTTPPPEPGPGPAGHGDCPPF
ncbi:hypothetical protein ACPCSP_29315 [Streptomyces cinereoruber]